MMKNITFLLISVILLSCQSSSTVEEGAKPNVVIILIDDEGYGDVGCYGATGFQTPNLDNMAANGMRFTNFYSPQAVCSASRAGLMTGCYPNRVGISMALFPHHNIGLNTEEYTIAEMFHDQGYSTACYGKWHLGWQKEFLPLQHGFDEFVGLPYSNDMWPRSSVTGELIEKKQVKYPELPLIEGDETISTISSLKDQDKLTRLFTERAVDFIDRNAQNPFFLYVPHVMAHVPLGVSDQFRGKSEQGLYGDVMMEIDWSVGQIMDALEKNDLTENTIVIFTTDNGPWLSYGNHGGSTGGLREGKLTSWEGGQRVPFIIKWPDNVPEGMVCNKLACGIDLLPTLASLTEGNLSDNKIDGVDISALFKGQFEENPREHLLYYLGKNNLHAVRQENWKLVLPHSYNSNTSNYGNDGHNGKTIRKQIEEPELYNLRRDPGEVFNVIDSHPDKANEMMKIVEKARMELGDMNVGIAKGSENREAGRLD